VKTYLLLALLPLCSCMLAAAEPARTRAGTRVSTVADTVPPWDVTMHLGAGYDSNALQLDDRSQQETSTAVYSTDATVGWRPLVGERDVLRLTGTVGYDRRPQLDDLDTTRAGIGVATAKEFAALVGGASLNLQRYWVGGKGVATEVRSGVGVGWLRQGSADLLALEAAVVPIDTLGDGPAGLAALIELNGRDESSGLLGAANYRHWWMLEAWRIEAGLRGGRFLAEVGEETYNVVQPWIALRWRTATWMADARLATDWRAYDAARTVLGSPESNHTTIAGLSLDRSLGHDLWLGTVLGAGVRSSDAVDRDYQRWLAALRLTWSHRGE
jgi:hypothetical protein